MYYKKQILVFLLVNLMIVILIEIAYNFMPNIGANDTSVRKQQIQTFKYDTKIEQAVFGSSVSQGILGKNPYIYKNVFNGTTVYATTLMGQYFLNSLLETKVKLKRSYFCFMPSMLPSNVVNMKDPLIKRYFNEVFYEKKYIDILKQIDKNYKPEKKIL